MPLNFISPSQFSMGHDQCSSTGTITRSVILGAELNQREPPQGDPNLSCSAFIRSANRRLQTTTRTVRLATRRGWRAIGLQGSWFEWFGGSCLSRNVRQSRFCGAHCFVPARLKVQYRSGVRVCYPAPFSASGALHESPHVFDHRRMTAETFTFSERPDVIWRRMRAFPRQACRTRHYSSNDLGRACGFRRGEFARGFSGFDGGAVFGGPFRPRCFWGFAHWILRSRSWLISVFGKSRAMWMQAQSPVRWP